jgi:hypothetical protein
MIANGVDSDLDFRETVHDDGLDGNSKDIDHLDISRLPVSILL